MLYSREVATSVSSPRVTAGLVPLAVAATALLASCTSSPQSPAGTFDYASEQLRVLHEQTTEQLAANTEDSRRPRVSPRTIEEGEVVLVPSRDWTSGFYPGILWMMYEHTGEDFWLEAARERTADIEPEKLNGTTHDMGFKIYCSFGQGYRLTGDERYRDVIVESASTLITRFNPAVGATRSWDHNTDKWDYPVIIDNMMNLELLFRATQLTGDSTYYDIAVTHAATTMREHFREDDSSFHVIDFNPETGEVQNRNTHQGYAHESAWARGQAWGLYGFTMTYRFTGDPVHLAQAERIAEFMLNHPNLPEDGVPYWDFNAPGIPDEPRDVSAATIMASALYELSTLDTDEAGWYREQADRIFDSVDAGYRSGVGERGGFLLDHSTGNWPKDSEVDVPIVYADYYYLEAAMRRAALEAGESAVASK